MRTGDFLEPFGRRSLERKTLSFQRLLIRLSHYLLIGRGRIATIKVCLVLNAGLRKNATASLTNRYRLACGPGKQVHHSNTWIKMPDSIDYSRKLVLVLGASGFIGSRVVAELARSPIYRPVAASRRSGLIMDATNLDSMRAALRDIDCIVNCIAGNNRTMVRSTEVLCNAARVSPPRRIIHLSSMAIYGAATGIVHEGHIPVVPVSGYGQAKIECERIVQKYVADGGDAVILRPTCVFGAGSTQWTTRLARLLQAHRLGDLGIAGDGCCNLAFIDDVVAAIVSTLDAPDISGRVFNISSSAELTWNEFLIAFAKGLGATPIQRITPRMLLIETKLLAPLRRIAAIALRSSRTEAITPSLAALWRQDIRVDCTAAESALALRRTTPDRMIAAAIQQERGLMEPIFS